MPALLLPMKHCKMPSQYSLVCFLSQYYRSKNKTKCILKTFRVKESLLGIKTKLYIVKSLVIGVMLVFWYAAFKTMPSDIWWIFEERGSPMIFFSNGIAIQGGPNICGHGVLSTPYFGIKPWKCPVFESKAMKMVYFWIFPHQV